ncbi:hypothetical protein R69888_00707 [Paraburkholderia haematera]|uniref:Uncharacterized protein n=1 Tax=Paraburkholderia haematera TaxID=2793077 RepID=A0ABN7KLZ4_9BURK|nr:hypothetical protein R69888_00707 [Paraburkholderia haematera]
MTFERILQPLQDLVLVRFRFDGPVRFVPHLAILFDEVAHGYSGSVDSVLPLVDLDFFLPRPSLGSTFRFERFCYTLPSLARLGTPATACWQD